MMRNIPQKSGISKMKHIGNDGKNNSLSKKKIIYFVLCVTNKTAKDIFDNLKMKI